MSPFVKALRHAFAVRTTEAAPPPLPPPLERFAREVVDRGLAIPASVMIEAAMPLSFLASQALFAASPIARALTMSDTADQVAAALSDRRTVAALIARIEALVAGQGDPA